jgi:nucleotide-binding universal stress UspA family protein
MVGVTDVSHDRVMSPIDQQNTILVGVPDGSRDAADAVALATALASPLDGVVVAGHVQARARTSNDSAHAIPREPASSLDSPTVTLGATRSVAGGLERLADRRGAQLIALGASDRSRMGRLFGRGTAERLLSNSPLPIAIAPSGYSDSSPRMDTIGVAFDGSPESRAALDWAKTLARQAHLSLRILTVHEPPPSTFPGDRGPIAVAQDELTRSDLDRRLAAASHDAQREGIDVEAVSLEGHAASVLQQESGALDLLVIGSRQRGPTRAVLQGSVSRHLVRHATGPVLVVPVAPHATDRALGIGSLDRTACSL